MEQAEEIKIKSQMSPKLAFLFGLVCAVALVSIIGFVVLLNKQGKGTNAGAGDIGATAGGEQGISVIEVAKAVGLDSKKFQSCVDNRTYKDKVQSEAADAGAAGGQGTPYSIIVGSKGEVFTVSGALPYEFFKAVVDALLKGEDPSSTISSDFKDYLTAAPDIALKPISKDDHIRGSLDAKVKIIEYSDFECPFCKRHHPVMKQLESAYAPDDFAWIYRHFPLSSIHPNAQPLAEASECASEIGGNNGFWAFTDKIFGA